MSNKRSLRGDIEEHIRNYFALHEGAMPEAKLYDSVIKMVEEVLIQETLKYTGNVQTETAKILGINRNTLYKKMQQFHLK